MKKALLITFIICFSLAGSAQSLFNSVSHQAGDLPGSFFIKLQGDYYLSTERVTVGEAYLQRYNASGQIKFRKPMPDNCSGAIRTFDNKLLFVSKQLWCDINPGYYLIYLSKVDTNGQALFFEKDTVLWQGTPKGLIQFSTDSTYYFFHDSTFYHHGQNGQLLGKVKPGFNSVTAAIELPNQQILVSALKNGQPSLIAMSSNGVVSSVQAFTEGITKFERYGNQGVIGMGQSHTLYKITSGLSLVSQSAFANNMSVSDFSMQNDSVFLALNSPGQMHYAIADTSFSILHLSSTNHQNFRNAFVLPTLGNRVDLCSLGEARTNANTVMGDAIDYSTSFTAIKKFSGTSYAHDLALVSVVADSMYSINPFSSPATSLYMKPKVKIKNLGSTVINTFKLNTFEYMSIDGCTKYYYSEQFTNLNVFPGDSAEVHASSYAFFPYSGVSNGVASTSLCFYVTAPNGDIDKVLLNNEFCSTFSVAVTGITEHSSGANALQVFPNPLEATLNLTSSEEMVSLRVSDVLGRTYLSVAAKQERNLSVSTETWPAGVYLIEVKTEKGMVTKKVLKN